MYHALIERHIINISNNVTKIKTGNSRGAGSRVSRTLHGHLLQRRDGSRAEITAANILARPRARPLTKEGV